MIPYEEARELLHGILQGLNDAHEAGLIHGDLKPANIRFRVDASGTRGLPKLADFGAARRLREESAAVRGSTNWMAPELVRGAVATKESDYFSFGIVAYLALTGRHPYFADDPSCLTSEEDNIVSSTFAPQYLRTLRPEVPPRVAALVMELLSADPSVRVRAGQDLVAALAQPSADEESASTPARRPAVVQIDDWSSLTAAYDDARRQFFAEYQPRAAIDTIDAALAQIQWERLAGEGVELVADCWSLRAFINNSSGRFREAVESASHGLEVDSDHVNSLHCRGYAYVQLGQNREAASDLLRARDLAVNPTKRRQVRTLLATVEARLAEDSEGEDTSDKHTGH